MTVQKECQMCKKLFVTRTAKSARWEKHCLECYLKVKNTKSFQLKRYEEFEETKLKSIRIDIAKLQQEVDALPTGMKASVYPFIWASDLETCEGVQVFSPSIKSNNTFSHVTVSTGVNTGAVCTNDLLANVCKQHVTKDTFEIGRLAQDLAGGLVGSMPSGIDFNEGEMSSELKKYLKGIKETNAEDRVKILRLIENMTLGRNAVAYLTESLHGAGSPQAQRVQIKRKVNIEEKKDLAKKLSGVNKKDKN